MQGSLLTVTSLINLSLQIVNSTPHVWTVIDNTRGVGDFTKKLKEPVSPDSLATFHLRRHFSCVFYLY